MNSQLIDINKALNNPFFDALTNDMHALTENIGNRKGFSLGKNNYNLLSSAERRTSRTFQLASSLTTIVGDIRTVYILIKRRPAKSYLERHDISELDYFKFHYEVFMHKVHTICEIMKYIANEVLKVNLHPKDCTWSNLIKHSKFNSSPCKRVIQEYYDAFQQLIEHRHLNAHRGIFEDKEMDEINLTYNIYRWYSRHELAIDERYKKLFPYAYVKYRVKKFQKDKLKAISEFEQLILTHIKNFFTTLEWTNQ